MPKKTENQEEKKPEVVSPFFMDNNNSENPYSALEKIKKVCKEKLAEYEQPVKFKFDDKLPLTSIGKIDAFKVQGEETEENSSSNSMVRIRK